MFFLYSHTNIWSRVTGTGDTGGAGDTRPLCTLRSEWRGAGLPGRDCEPWLIHWSTCLGHGDIVSHTLQASLWAKFPRHVSLMMPLCFMTQTCFPSLSKSLLIANCPLCNERDTGRDAQAQVEGDVRMIVQSAAQAASVSQDQSAVTLWSLIIILTVLRVCRRLQHRHHGCQRVQHLGHQREPFKV